MRAALFDMDETILDRTGSLRDFAFWQATRMLRFSVSDADHFVMRFAALDQRGMVWKDRVYESLIEEFEVTGWTVDELLQTYLLTFCAFCKPRDGAVEAIREFRSNGYRIGLVTNGKSPFQERNFRALGIDDLFDSVVVSEAVGLRKPDSAIFEHACHAVGADLHTSIFIGDNPVSDIKGAKEAGMGTVYVPIDLEYDPCEEADSTYGTLLEIVGHVERQS